MHIYTTLQIGDFHLDHCEDYFFTGSIGEHKLVCAVMDGCTMGRDSYFASTLVGKLLRKIVTHKGYRELYTTDERRLTVEDNLKEILRELFKELNIVKNQLVLGPHELLTTLILLLADKKEQAGVVVVVGDGVVCINGELTEFDQDNKPDYLGFHLDEPFDAWYDAQQQKIHFNTVEDIGIATDGILQFTRVSNAGEDEEADPVHLLMMDKSGTEKEDMLDLKLKKLEHSYGLRPGDDLAIVRFINPPVC